ncbi:MAG: hypothetical protein ACPGEB_03820, partial [Schleiferiaceae bacterium]
RLVVYVNTEGRMNSNNFESAKDLDIEKLFLGLQPSSTPEIYSDPGDAADYNKAQILSDNLKSEFVFKL